jgi:hypothetical protein
LSTNNYIENKEKYEEKIPYPYCGSDMKVDKILENAIVKKCTGCSLSDTRLNS